MKRIQKIGMLMIMLGCASGDSITFGTSMIAPVLMIAAGAGIMYMTKEGKR